VSLTVKGCALDGEAVSLRCEGGMIAALGPQVEAAAGDEVIDAEGMLLLPPFVNGHTHAAMTLFRGFGDDRPLMDWLENYIWPAEAKLEPEDVYWGTRLAAAEMLRSGTTRFVDMYWHSSEVARAVRDTGIRAVVSSVLIDGLDPKRGGELRENAISAIDELGDFGPLVTPAFGPHAIYTVSGESLRWLAETAAERELMLNIHLSETEQEVGDCLSAHGKRPAHYLDDLGFLGPRTALAHGVWLDASELELIAERGATVVSNPGANMKLAVGAAFPYPGAAAAGVGLGLGTDGVSSNNSLDMLEEVKLFALLQKHTTADPAVVPAAEALAIARGQRSGLLGGAPLEPGRDADFILLRGDALELTAGNLDAALAYAALGSIVDTAVVAGKVVMRGREVEGAAEAADQVRARTERLTGVSR
jgi:5-methylthioadenosine/S-adenosylhomocysteine deaminase